jgi:hypothetical protein
MTEIQLTDAAAALVKADVSSFKADKRRYAAYIAEMDVTLDTVADHVSIFREAFKASRGNSEVSGDEVKAYATKVRNGLNYNLGKTATKSEATALLTSLGEQSTREEVLAAWEEANADEMAVAA